MAQQAKLPQHRLRQHPSSELQCWSHNQAPASLCAHCNNARRWRRRQLAPACRHACLAQGSAACCLPTCRTVVAKSQLPSAPDCLPACLPTCLPRRVPGQAPAPIISKTGSKVTVQVRPPANTGGAGRLCGGAFASGNARQLQLRPHAMAPVQALGGWHVSKRSNDSAASDCTKGTTPLLFPLQPSALSSTLS